MPEETVLIQPAPVERDAEGYWLHPDLPVFEEGEADKSKAWVAAQGLTVRTQEMEYDVDTDTDPYFASGGTSCAHWTPSKPEGDEWFCLGISLNDDGPVCWWARREVTP